MAKVNLACPVERCCERFEFKTGNAQLHGFVDDRDHGCITVTIVGDPGAVSEHMRREHANRRAATIEG